jgi:putative YhgA-like transposase
MSDSDSLYHGLFSHPQMVAELVREFVPEALAAGLDFSGLQRVNPKFHVGRRSARRRESDVIWRLPTRGDTDVYLLFEFQSKTDWLMAVRTQAYQALLWQQVTAEKELKTGARLPPLLLLVLYNGVSRWNTATNVRELVALSPNSPLWPWQPQVQYHLLDIGAFPREKLARRANLAALLFRLEQRTSNEELEELADEVAGWFRQHPDHEDLRRLFAELVSREYTESGIPRPIPEDLLMFKSSIPGTLRRWARYTWRKERAEARAEGRAEGRVEGKAEGKAEALLCLLAERFGALKPSLHKRIRGADLATLDRWFKRAIVAPDLLSVFGRLR